MRALHLKLLGVAALAVLLVAPSFINSYIMHIFIMIFSFAYLSLAWNIISGFGGQLSLGHALFFGVGSYTSTLCLIKLGLTPWVGMILGGLISGMIAVPIGIIMFQYKLKGVFFAISTLAFAEIFRILASNLRFLGGSEGLLIPIMESSFAYFQFRSKLPYYYISLAMMLGMIAICYAVKKSKLYLYLFALKADEEAAEAIGVYVTKYKIYAFVMSAFFTAFNGTFFAQYYMFIEPETTCSVTVSVDILLRPIIGGLGTLFGPVLGSFIMTPLSEVVRNFLGSGISGLHLLLYGMLLVVICIWMPSGILPYMSRIFSSR